MTSEFLNPLHLADDATSVQLVDAERLRKDLSPAGWTMLDRLGIMDQAKAGSRCGAEEVGVRFRILAPASSVANIGAADELEAPLENVQGTLVAAAPVVGSARSSRLRAR
jgi:hypothetical protein